MRVSLSFTKYFVIFSIFSTQLPLNRAGNLSPIHLELGFDWVAIYWFKKIGFDRDRFRLYPTDPLGVFSFVRKIEHDPSGIRALLSCYFIGSVWA